MASPVLTEAKIIQMTMENVRSFYSRNQAVTAAPMSDDFVWIGSNDFQWCAGRETFFKITKKEYAEPPMFLSDEEYHLLFHDRNVWAVYGRYKITAVLGDGSVLHAHVRGTYLWRVIHGELNLVHVHSSHAQDIPLNQIAPPPEPFTENSAFFDYMKRMDAVRANEGKIAFRDREKNYRYLFPSDILYLKAAAQRSLIYTITGSFEVWGVLAEYEKKLPAGFLRIHRSYLVNRAHIDRIRRYQALLRDGQALPIGKERYMEVKQALLRGAVSRLQR